jgi:hypothetical protein
MHFGNDASKYQLDKKYYTGDNAISYRQNRAEIFTEG